MPRPPVPPDLRHCNTCGKVVGPHRGWFGAECQCSVELQHGTKGGHSIRGK